MTENAFFSRLKGRGLLRISGADAQTFLQGLITNDIKLLDQHPNLYACLLTPQGKFLYDFFITKNSDTFLLDCEGGDRTTALSKLLNMYKLRAHVMIETIENSNVYAIFGAQIGTPDPRHPDMGYRSFEQPQNVEERPFEEWDHKRISLCIPDGSRDLIPQNSTMDEGHMDQLNAVSYDKGCYMGQELTARMHYRGLGKKHLKTVNISELSDGAELRSTCRDIGIALVKEI